MHQTKFTARGRAALCLSGTVTGALQLIMVAIMLADTAQGMIRISFRYLFYRSSKHLLASYSVYMAIVSCYLAS